MLKMGSLYIRLSRFARQIQQKYSGQIEDIILYGSAMKGKEDPNDIDVLVIFKKEVNKQIEVELKKKIGNPLVDINSITSFELKGEDFAAKEGLILEGKSLISNQLISESLGFAAIGFIKYDLGGIKGSERVRFYYALQGREGKEGFLSRLGAKRYSDNIIVCDYSVVEKVKPFLEHWKLEYVLIPALIPKQLSKLLFRD